MSFPTVLRLFAWRWFLSPASIMQTLRGRVQVEGFCPALGRLGLNLPVTLLWVFLVALFLVELSVSVSSVSVSQFKKKKHASRSTVVIENPARVASTHPEDNVIGHTYSSVVLLHSQAKRNSPLSFHLEYHQQTFRSDFSVVLPCHSSNAGVLQLAAVGWEMCDVCF